MDNSIEQRNEEILKTSCRSPYWSTMADRFERMYWLATAADMINAAPLYTTGVVHDEKYCDEETRHAVASILWELGSELEAIRNVFSGDDVDINEDKTSQMYEEQKGIAESA